MTAQAGSSQIKVDTLTKVRRAHRSDPTITISVLCKEQGISKSTYYAWCEQEREGDLAPKSRKPHTYSNQLDPKTKQGILFIQEQDPFMTPYAISQYLFERAEIRVSHNTVRKVLETQFGYDVDV